MARRTVPLPKLFALGSNQVSGSIVISAITPPPNPESLGSMTISGSGDRWSASTSGGVSTISLNPQTYPLTYRLTFELDPSVAEQFTFASLVGQLTFVSGTVQSCGFLLDSPVLQMFLANPPITDDVTYNLAVGFQSTGEDTTPFWVGDPTIVFEPPV